MTRKPFEPTGLANALQAASLLVIAGGLFGILISAIIRQPADVVRAAAPSQVQLIASPHESDAKSRMRTMLHM
jgi:hypothetical protein